jgi:hypothetical protein
MPCKTCGIHFQEDFYQTLAESCTFWIDRNFPTTFPEKYKWEVWNWLYALPTDEMSKTSGTQVSVNIIAAPSPYADDFEALVPGYVKWDDKQRKDFQRGYFKYLSQMTLRDSAGLHLFAFMRTKGLLE